ncbi:MAG: hypothetical protein A4E49_00207 [Methanosaeta sp. PtaU1.Bin112]|nr:MAG: hypothetical protein A4E49_00207 [Methanosaeta sp. PtaU1.Bin112]
MDDDKFEPTLSSSQAKGASGCGDGCNCGGSKSGTKGKAIVCLVVAIAAAVVLANSVVQKADTGVGGMLNEITAKVLSSGKAFPIITAENANETGQTDSSLLWGKPLESLASLDEFALQKDAIFLYLPSKDKGPEEGIKKEIEAAAGTAQSRGTRIGFFIVDESSSDYAKLTSQVPAPCVLAIVNGTGNIVATTNITELNLLRSLVAASRPSGCSPRGCAVPC